MHQTLQNQLQINKSKNNNISDGTTIIAFKYANGILLAADSKTSAGVRIANLEQRKIIQLNNHCWVMCSGASAHTRFLCRTVRNVINSIELQNNQQCTIHSIAQLFSKYNHSYKFLQAGMIVTGFDKTGYHIFTVKLGGSIFEEQQISFSGSGSTYVLGLIDNNYKQNMTRQEAIQFGKTLIEHAIYRDGHSGGLYRYVVIEDQQMQLNGMTNWVEIVE